METIKQIETIKINNMICTQSYYILNSKVVKYYCNDNIMIICSHPIRTSKLKYNILINNE